MAKKAYIGVSGVARTARKIYVGVGGVARKVKKGYVGVGGVARQFYTSGARFTITGEAGVDWILHGDLDADWWLEILASCAITFESSARIDACLIGAGASGDAGQSYNSSGLFYANAGNGGGAGEVLNQLGVAVAGGTTYQLTVGKGGAAVTGFGAAVPGNAGGDTSAFGYSADGGTPSAGGEAAHGSTPGGDGDDGSYPFGDSSFGTRYGAEGGGGAKAVNTAGSWVEMQPAGAGGDDGGGDGGNIDGNAGDATVPGSGGGGRGGVSVSGLYSGAGGDGIVIIRPHTA